MEYHPDLQKSWALPLNLPHPRALPAQAVPSDDVDRLKLLSQIILRESPIQPDLPLLPQLIERQKLLRHLIYGPSASSSHIIPTTTTTPTNGMTSLNPLIQAQLAQLVPQRTMNPVTTTSAFTSLPSTSRTVIPTTAPSFQPAPQGPGKITDTHRNSSRSDTPIDVVHVDSVSGRSSPSDMTQSRKRKLSSDNTSPSSSLEISTSPHLFELSEKNFTEVFCKEGASVTCPPHQKVSDDRPNTQLIALLNRCVSNMKSLLSQRGVPVSVDDNGMPVDYSSRPVDAIFKQSRKQLEMARSYHSDKNKS